MVVMSCKCGKLRTVTLSLVRSVAARIGKAAFFAPETFRVPSSRRPPRISKLPTVSPSVATRLSGGQRTDIDRVDCTRGDDVRQRGINALLAGNRALALKHFGDHGNSVMPSV